MLTRDALREAAALGLPQRPLGGDVLVTLPGWRSVRVPVPTRQKDAPVLLVKMLDMAREGARGGA